MIQKPASFHKFPASFDEKPASFSLKVTRIKIDLRQVRFWYSLELIIPISDFLLYPSHTCLSVSYSAGSCEGCEGYPFFCLDAKEPKNQDHIRSFLLKEKNQKFKAHTTEATVLVAALKSRKTRLRLKQPRFFNAPLGRPLNTSSVRPKQLKIENWELKIYKAGLHGGI